MYMFFVCCLLASAQTVVESPSGRYAGLSGTTGKYMYVEPNFDYELSSFRVWKISTGSRYMSTV
jgi:hypothetical protein